MILEDGENTLTVFIRQLIHQLWQHWQNLEQQVDQLQNQIEQLAKQNSSCRSLMTIPGVGPLTASALVSKVGDSKEFKMARELAAYLGLVPRQHSTGGKQTLLGISKRGDIYLGRCLFMVLELFYNLQEIRLTASVNG